MDEQQPIQSVVCSIQRDVDIYVALVHGRDFTARLHFNAVDRTRIEIVILELARNLIVHAGGGALYLEHVVTDTGHSGLAIEATDHGPGIPDIPLAMRDGYSTTRTLGAGLPGVKRLMDEFSIESTVGVGTRVRAIKWCPQRQEKRS